MKVLIVNTSERTGGAAVASNRLMKALNKNGVEAKMLVNNKQTDDPRVIEIPGRWRKKFNFIWERGLIFALNGLSRKRLFDIDTAFCGTDITKLDCFKEADVIHLHWVNQGMLSMRGLRKILRSGKKVVWTMHDQWCSTGICHYSFDCPNFKTECKDCMLLKYPGAYDLSRRTFRRKAKLYSQAKNLTFVTCSRWLRDIAKTSALFRKQQVVSIPNPIDMEVFKPLDRTACRTELNLPQGKKLILVGAVNVMDERKGAAYLIEVLNKMASSAQPEFQNVEIACMGNGAAVLQEKLTYKVHALNYVSSEAEMAKIYSAVDFYLTPSLSDNLPNMIMEAMSCGTPCVGFEVGGIPEMIDHLQNGYIAKIKSISDLQRGVLWAVKNADIFDKEEIRKAVRKKFSEETVSSLFINLYKQILHEETAIGETFNKLY